MSELNWSASLQQQSCTTQDTSIQGSSPLVSCILGLDLDGVSVSGTVLDLSVDCNVWSIGLSGNSVTILDADSDSPSLDSAVTQSNDLSGDLVNWCVGSWGRSSL